MRIRTLLAIISLGALLSSCSEKKTPISALPEQKPIVQSVNYPLYYFAKRLAEENFDHRYIVDREKDPAFWKPTDTDVQAFQEANLIIKNGANYAKWMKTVSLPTSRLLDTSASFGPQLIEETGTAHQHGEGDAHQHGNVAFTVWIDFTLAEKQAQAIAGRLTSLAPNPGESISKNFEHFTAELQDLDQRMMEWSKKWGDRPLLVSHPVYQYWARRYGLNVRSVHWEPEMKWDHNRATELDKITANHPAQWMMWEATPTPDLVKKLKEKGIESIIFDPCGNHPGEGNDWMTVMKKNITELQKLSP